MAVFKRYVCDGCGQDSGNKPLDYSFEGWGNVSVRLSEFKAWKISPIANVDKRYILCEYCQQRLVDEANPLKWVRIKDAI